MNTRGIMEPELWYKTINPEEDEIHQGDIINGCPILVPPPSINLDGENDVGVEVFDVVVLSQSCDLEQGNIKIVLVCPVFNFTEVCKSFPENEKSAKGIKSRFNKFKKGTDPNYHLLDKAPDIGIQDFLIADFRSVYGIHIDSLKHHVKNSETARFRLLSPYREHIAQAFARFMMRVGLPQNIPPLTKEEEEIYSKEAKAE